MPEAARTATGVIQGSSFSPHRERARHALDAVDEVRAQHLRRAGDLEVGQAREDLAEHHAHLAAREVGAEAVVRAGAAEADVLVRRARHVEAVGTGRTRPRRDSPSCTRARPSRRRVIFWPAELGVARRGAAEVDHRRRPAHDLLDRRRRHALEVGRPLAALVREVAERLHAVADGVARGLVAGDHEQHEERRQLLPASATRPRARRRAAPR